MMDMGMLHPTDLRIELAHSCFEMAYESFLSHGNPLRLLVDTDVLYKVHLTAI